MFNSEDKGPFDRTLTLAASFLCKQLGFRSGKAGAGSSISEEPLVLQKHGVTLDPGLHIKLLLIPSDKAFLTTRNVTPALEEIRPGPGNHAEREQGLASTPGVPKHYSRIKTCPQVRAPVGHFGGPSSVKCQFLGESVISDDHLLNAECKKENSADASSSAGKRRVLNWAAVLREGHSVLWGGEGPSTQGQLGEETG